MMKQKFLIRYLILTGILLVCAAGVWYWSEQSKVPSANAALVRAEQTKVSTQHTGAVSSINPEQREGNTAA